MMKYSYEYPRPAVTVDAAIFRKKDDNWQVLFIQRGNEPFIGMWALPGGFVEMNETLEEAVARELKEETGLEGVSMEQLHAFSTVNRDPRHRTISIVFWGLVAVDQGKILAGDDAEDAKWFGIDHLPELAFDHLEVMKMAVEKL